MPQSTKPSYSELEAALTQERQARTRAEQRLHELTRDHRFNNRVYSANRLVLDLQDAQRDRDFYEEKLQTAEKAAQEWHRRASELERLNSDVSEWCRMEKALFNSSLSSSRQAIDDLQHSLADAESRRRNMRSMVREELDTARRRLRQIVANQEAHAAKLKKPSTSNFSMTEAPGSMPSSPRTWEEEGKGLASPRTLKHKKRFPPGV
ncbi:hypothetical protein QBC41DRAFT_215512 [Cercophora samala]|uniref:Uncharacterized protein n=1 Tax=Cercophora samala TaxID=330535 RepID=A0AA40DDU1_9PEZI|nr:hypothetical protein QBC41DRAFT_215512 [Cercophora samala]